jgi:hypothetical protein
MFGRCERPGCWAKWTHEATLSKKGAPGKPIRWRFCREHADEETHLFVQGAGGSTQIDVLDDEGELVRRLYDEETAARRLALEKGWPVRRARRELERRAK